jgi:hypothetical protein
MLAACFLASYWLARVWEISLGISRCFSLAGGFCKFYATPEENDQYTTALIATQAAMTKLSS